MSREITSQLERVPEYLSGKSEQVENMLSSLNEDTQLLIEKHIPELMSSVQGVMYQPEFTVYLKGLMDKFHHKGSRKKVLNSLLELVKSDNNMNKVAEAFGNEESYILNLCGLARDPDVSEVALQILGHIVSSETRFKHNNFRIRDKVAALWPGLSSKNQEVVLLSLKSIANMMKLQRDQVYKDNVSGSWPESQSQNPAGRMEILIREHGSLGVPILKTFSQQNWIDAILIHFQGFYKIKALYTHPLTAVQEQAREIIQSYRDWYLGGAESLYYGKSEYKKRDCRKEDGKEGGDIAWVSFIEEYKKEKKESGSEEKKDFRFSNADGAYPENKKNIYDTIMDFTPSSLRSEYTDDEDE